MTNKKKPGRGRPSLVNSPTGLHTPIFARVDDATHSALTAYRDGLQASNPGLSISISDAVRLLLLDALSRHSQKAA